MSRPRKDVSEALTSVYRGGDGLWHARVPMGRRPDGAVERVHRVRQSKAALMVLVRDLERQRDEGTWVATADDPTLAAWVAHWLTAVVHGTVEPATERSYEGVFRLHVLPTLGGVRLKALRAEHIETLYAGLRADGVGEPTVALAHRSIRACLNEAVRRRRLTVNPLAQVRFRRARETEVEPLTVAEARAVLATAAEQPRNRARWSFALALGLRQGEALGLLWDDVDLAAGTLRVRRALKRLDWQHGCSRRRDTAPRCGGTPYQCPRRHSGGLHLRQTKTAAGSRVWTLPAGLVEELRAHRAAQAAERLRAGDAWGLLRTGERWTEGDLVFTTEVGTPIDPRSDNRAWAALLAEAGVREARLHDARHSAATLLLLQGVPERVVKSLMGWSDTRMVGRYQHVVEPLRAEAASRVQDALWASE